MNDIFMKVIALSITGSLFIGILFLFRIWYKKRFSKRWQYYIWLLVIARLLIPFTPKTNAMSNIINKFDIVIEKQIDNNTIEDKNKDLDNEYRQQIKTTVDTSDKQRASIPIASKITRNRIWENTIQYAWLAWIMVGSMLLVKRIITYRSFLKQLKINSKVVSDIEVLERISTIEESLKLHSKIEIYTNPMISSPLFIGILRPSIVLPTTDLSDRNFKYTLSHELTHYKRKDILYKWILQITICIHWFNPLVYFIVREVNRLCELSCDEFVIHNLDKKEQHEYGDTLLDMLKLGGTYRNTQVTLALNENKKLLQERLQEIKEFHKRSKVVKCFSLVCILLLSVLATESGVFAANKTINSQNESSVTTESNGKKIVKENLDNSSSKKSEESVDNSYNKTNKESVDNSNDEEDDEELVVFQAGYYEEPYILILRNFISGSIDNYYDEKIKIKVNSQSKVDVYFEDNCKKYMKNQEFKKALKSTLSKLQKANDNGIKEVVVIDVKKATEDLETMAKAFYKNDDLWEFSAIITSLSKKQQLYYCMKMIDDEKVAFLGSVMGKVDKDIVDACAEKAYKEDKVACLGSIKKYVSDKERKKLDNKNS